MESGRIAIVGTGISGLTAAYLLARRHEIVVFEADDRIGGHSHTVQVAGDAGTLGVDTGFIVHNRRTYPNFCRLLEQLDVDTRPSDMSFGFRDERTGLEYAAPALRGLFAQPSNLLRPRHWWMIGEVLRFYREAPRALDSADVDEELDLETWLDRRGFGEAFKEDHLFPVASSIWSGGRRRLGEFPVRAFVRFFRNHGLLSLNDRPRWRTIVGGSVRYVEKLSAPFRHAVRLNTPVTGIRRDDAGVEVRTPNGPPERFDQVVLACHADQSLTLLEDPTPLERELLGAFPYAANDVALHTDTRILPRRRAAWASWNHHRLEDDADRVALTYDMNRLQGLPGDTRWLVTLNRTDALSPERIVGRYEYHHPQYDARAIGLQPRHDELNGRNRTWYCGAYWGYGFHEDGVASALRVAKRFGEEL